MNTVSINHPLITVIVPVYKVENYIRNCIMSVQNQTYNNWELILVDDGSPDNCGQICDEYAAKGNRIKVIHKENGGQAQARNRGLDVCHGEYVTFLDSDDFLHLDCLSYMVGLAEKFEADIVQCDFTRGTETTFPEMKRSEMVETLDNHSVFLQGKANVIVCGKLYKKEIVNTHRIREGRYFEDDYTTWKWYYAAKKIVVSNKALYYYTENPMSTMAQHSKKPNFDFFGAYDERINFFKGTKEKDLEHCSRLQLCKSLVLSYSHKQLTKEDRLKEKQLFNENWKVLRHSPYIGKVYKTLFMIFNYMPLTASNAAVRLHAKK